MAKTSLYLSVHAFVCLADNHYVFLDLRRDEYLCLGRMHTDSVKSMLNGNGILGGRSADSRIQGTGNSDSDAVVHALLKKGLLVENEACGKLPALPRVASPSRSLMTDSHMTRAATGPACGLSFFAAAAAASVNLRWHSIERTVREVENRKADSTTAGTAVDSGAITDLFSKFRALRPYYPRSYLCLFDSLVLIHFLARYGIYPQWVFGVKMEPFGAHCWVQADDLVINDIVENVTGYTPIMSV